MVPASVEIRRVYVTEGCIVCNLCEDTCPEVFTVTDETSVINDAAEQFYSEKAEAIVQSAEECPVEVIKIESE